MNYQSIQAPTFSSAGEPLEVSIEAAIRTGIPDFRISGLPPWAAREMNDRILCALQMSGFRVGHKTITVHLGGNPDPAILEELDLPVAGCILKALGHSTIVDGDERASLLGKLSLSGEVRPLLFPGRSLVAAGTLGFAQLYCNISWKIPQELPIPGSAIHGPLGRLKDVVSSATAGPPSIFRMGATAPSVGLIGGEQENHRLLDPNSYCLEQWHAPASETKTPPALPYSRFVLRAAVACAEGGHSLLCIGPPGSGKTTLAHLIYDMLPPARDDELRSIYLRTNALSEQESIMRPFRRPHHSATRVALVGGGKPIRAGEVTLACHGLLLLDELAEFKREVLQALREPLDCGKVHLSRGAVQEVLPARFWTVATSNPCPCGLFGSGMQCQCGAEARHRYQLRLLGPLQDRMNMELFLASEKTEFPVEEVNEWRKRLRTRQVERARKHGCRYNSALPEELLPFSPDAEHRFRQESGPWSNRKRIGIRRLCRSIADMSGAAWIQMEHLLEGLRYADLPGNVAISQGNATTPWQSD